MFSIIQTPPTTVEHSVQCNFYCLEESNLVVAGSNQLIIYRIIRETNKKHTREQPEENIKLEYQQSFELYGTVASLEKIIIGCKSNHKRDSLVLSFHDAKLSIVEYNPEQHDLKTISMHYFEDETLRDGWATNHMHPPTVRVDPEHRCISMLIYGRRIVVIPLDCEEEDEEEDLQHEFRANVSPVMPSYEIDLTEETCGEKIDNIVDIQFLHNYNDPTLVILHEPTRTWSGRIAMRQDTFSMVALSMNVHQRLQPIIWTVDNLPYDSLRILPVPKPIGGLLIIASNELIYLNQSVPAFGMSFNSFTKDSSAFPLNDQDESDEKTNYINISLDLSQAVFLNHNKILFILKDGDVYLVSLFNDDMRSIKKFHFEQIASTVQPNCLTLCANNLLFIGSHIGDSVLAEIIGDLKSDLMDSYEADDVDSLYSTEEKEPVYLYEHDKLLSTSSSGRICYGEAPNISENLSHDYRDPHVELIATSGQHKNGSICVFQRTIKPYVEDTYDGLRDCGGLWTLMPSMDSEPTNSRLLLNKMNETMVFSTKGELVELKRDECSFETNEPTVLAANIGEDNLSVQVMSTSVQLISDDKTIHHVKVEGKIVDACVADPHIIALTKNGSIYHFQLRSNSDESNDPEKQYCLSWHDIGSVSNGTVISLSIYKDVSGMFTCATNRNRDADTPTYWLLIVDDRGVLEIFSIPDYISVYSVDNFPSAPLVLEDNCKLFVRDLDATISKTREILMTGLGRNSKKPILFVRSEFELVIYEAYPFTEVDINNHLKIRFKKIHSLLLETILAPECAIESGDGTQHQQLALTDGRKQQNHYDLQDRSPRNLHYMREFQNIGGHKGVFLAGPRPHWFVMGDRGALRLHPMVADGAIFAFSQYSSDNFIYFTANRELRIARLPTHLDLDWYWPLRKLNMKETVHFVNYHVERKIYCVVSSKPTQCLKIMKVGSEPDTMKIEDLERENGYIPPTIEQFKLCLYDPEKWEQIPDCEIEFEEWEQVTCVKNVLLASEGTTSGLKGYIAMSTNYCYGEDVPNRGRIWILDLIEVVPEPDQPLTKNKIKKVYCQEQKGPVTTLSHTCGLLMSAVGQKIYLWQLKEGQLDGVAFIDTQIYIHCASSVKNLILVSDVCKSVSLLRYQQETRTLSMVCRDSKPLEVFACDFIVDNELLNFVVTDSERNIIIYAHDPEHEDSHGGTRLLRRADFHLGAHVTSFCRLRSKVPRALINDPHQSLFCRRRHTTMFCTVDGAIGLLFPIGEPIYRQFQMLQNEMTIALAHTAGLNPKAWRTVKQARPSITNPCKLILDGDIIKRFLLLSVRERNELTKKIGCSTEKVLADIQLILEATLFF